MKQNRVPAPVQYELSPTLHKARVLDHTLPNFEHQDPVKVHYCAYNSSSAAIILVEVM